MYIGTFDVSVASILSKKRGGRYNEDKDFYYKSFKAFMRSSSIINLIGLGNKKIDTQSLMNECR